jgi:tRNA/tmRNA/rRNA uracil-C5-methylase (TrmA/RlmC/RlmD family)
VSAVTVIHDDVGTALGRDVGPATRVVLDPPRAGAGAGVVGAITQRHPQRVVYVACDPAALARDVRTFRSYGYHLAQLRSHDLFPHTHHVESVALLIPS